MLSLTEVQLEFLKDLVHLMHQVRVLHHGRRVEADEVVLAHVVRQVSEDEGTLLGLINGRAIDLDVVAPPVHVILLAEVVDDLRGGHNPAVPYVEVEQGQKVVHVVRLHKIWSLQWQVEPTRHSNRFVTADIWTFLWEVLLNLHVNLVGMWVEVKHDGLLEEAVLTVHSCCYFVQVFVNSLLKIKAITGDIINVSFNV